MATQSTEGPPWGGLSSQKRTVISGIAILGYALFVLADLAYRLQGSTPVETQGALGYAPFILAAGVSAALVALSVTLTVTSSGPRDVDKVAISLGAAWLLASIPLLLDYLIDPFEVKLPIIGIFILVGFRYWKGVRNSNLTIVLAPFMALIAALDGFFHLMGNLCSSTGLDSCSVKGISDVYLVMIFILLTVLTLAGRNQRPRLLPLLLIGSAFAVALIALALLP